MTHVKEDAMIPLEKVLTLTGITRKNLLLLCRQRVGGFPMPVKDKEGTIVWWESEVVEYMRKRET